MAVIVKLPGDVVQVVPGAVATVSVTIRNTGTIVDQFTVEVLGDAAAWSTVEPTTISLFPAAEGQVLVNFAPPRSASVPAGTVVFGIRVVSREDPAGSAVEEGMLSIAAFTDTTAELLPRTSTGSRAATHNLAIDNRGNAALNATVQGSDADNLVNVGVTPPGLVIDPGTAAFARIRVAPRKSFWRGQPKTRPFKVQVETPGSAPLVLDGTMVQHAVLPGWFGKALLACLALLILATLLWFGLLAPAIKTTAEQALSDAGYTPHPAAAGATPTPAATVTSGATATAHGTPTSAATPVVTPAPTLPPGPSPTPPPLFAGTPMDGRLTANTGTASLTSLQPGSVLYITDLVFENPDGLFGSAQLIRGSLVIASLRLENYRDLDFHYVTPIVVRAAGKMYFSASCTTGLSTSAPGPCTPSVYFSGFTVP